MYLDGGNMHTVQSMATYVLETGNIGYYTVSEENINEVIKEVRKYYTNTHFISISIKDNKTIKLYRARQWAPV